MSGCTNPLKISLKNVFFAFSKSLLLLKEHFGAYRKKSFFGRGKGEKFPCFQCGKWKICKSIEGKNQENVQNPKGNVFSFLFQAALSSWPRVGTAERKLSLQTGSWLLGCCSCQGVSGTAVSQGSVGSVPGQLLPLPSRPFLQLVFSAGLTPAAPRGALGRLRQGPTALG